MSQATNGEGGAIYLVSKLWQDSMENRNAFGYEPIGYVSSVDEARELLPDLDAIEPANKWPLLEPTPRYTLRYIPRVRPTPPVQENAATPTE